MGMLRISGLLRFDARIVNYVRGPPLFLSLSLSPISPPLWRRNLAELSRSPPLPATDTINLRHERSAKEHPWTPRRARSIQKFAYARKTRVRTKRYRTRRREREREILQTGNGICIYIYIYTRVDPFFFAGSLIKVEVDNLVAMWAHVAMWIEEGGGEKGGGFIHACSTGGCRYSRGSSALRYRRKEEEEVRI